MIIRTLFFSLTLLLFSLTRTEASTPWPYQVTKINLENGLTVYLSEDHTTPEVFGMVAVKAGSKYDPPDATGMAHYLEHMLFKGTAALGTTDYGQEKVILENIRALYRKLETIDDKKEKQELLTRINSLSVQAGVFAVPNEMNRLLTSMGSQNINASTDEDTVLFYNSFPPHQMEKWLDLYSHRFTEPVFRLFQSELETVFEELNMYSDEFVYKLYENFISHFYQVHPYGSHTILGKPEHIKNPSLEKMYRFYNSYFVPSNMALILCGNFDTNLIVPLIREKFGSLKKGTAPSFPEYKETLFKGRKPVKKYLSPLNMGGLGFRTVPMGHKDVPGLEVLSFMLSNKNKTGLLDVLTEKKKLLYALVINRSLEDHGLSSIIFVPPFARPGLQKSEKLVLEELSRLGRGDYPDDFFQAAKTAVLMQYQKQLEKNRTRAHLIKDLYVSGRKTSYLKDYFQTLKNLTKEDVVLTAASYYGPDYLAFYSLAGFPAKEKVKKPAYTPPAPSGKGKSEYAEYFKTIPSGEVVFPGTDLTADVLIQKLPGGGSFYSNPNRVNTIFTLTLRFSHYDFKNPYSSYASYLEQCGTGRLDYPDFSNSLGNLGCYFSIYTYKGAIYLKLEGPDRNCLEALELIRSLLKNPRGEKKSFSRFMMERLADFWITRTRPDVLKEALLEYMVYKGLSTYKTGLPLVQTAALGHEGLLTEIKKLTANSKLDVFYTGTLAPRELFEPLTQLQSMEKDQNRQESQPRPFREKQVTRENSIIVLHRPRARQARCYIYIPGETETISGVPLIKTFNRYFGRGMSSRFFQEIRELRSLAYSAYAGYETSLYEGDRGFFTAYLGTQADKTPEALRTALGLLEHFEVKEEAFDELKEALIQELYGEQPHFRQLGKKVDAYLKAGYTSFPWADRLTYYRQVRPEDIKTFYTERLAGKPFVIGIIGNMYAINIEELKKIAPVRIIFPGKIHRF